MHGLLKQGSGLKVVKSKEGAGEQVRVLFQHIDTEEFGSLGSGMTGCGGFQENPSDVVEGKPERGGGEQCSAKARRSLRQQRGGGVWSG